METPQEEKNTNTAGCSESAPFSINHARQISDEQVDDIMAYHTWDETKVKKGQQVRFALGHALKVIVENVPPSPDRSAAIRKIREARMDCNSAITHGGKY